MIAAYIQEHGSCRNANNVIRISATIKYIIHSLDQIACIYRVGVSSCLYQGRIWSSLDATAWIQKFPDVHKNDWTKVNPHLSETRLYVTSKPKDQAPQGSEENLYNLEVIFKINNACGYGPIGY